MRYALNFDCACRGCPINETLHTQRPPTLLLLLRKTHFSSYYQTRTAEKKNEITFSHVQQEIICKRNKFHRRNTSLSLMVRVGTGHHHTEKKNTRKQLPQAKEARNFLEELQPHRQKTVWLASRRKSEFLAIAVGSATRAVYHIIVIYLRLRHEQRNTRAVCACGACLNHAWHKSNTDYTWKWP